MSRADPASTAESERIVWHKECLGGMVAGMLGLGECMAVGAIAFAALGPGYAASALVAGLYAYILVNLVSAPLAGTRNLIAGPLPGLALTLGSAMAILQAKHGAALGDPLVILFFVVFVAGLLQVLYGALRLGGLAKYFPQPIVAGLMNGAALSIILAQLHILLGVPQSAALWHTALWQGPVIALSVSTIAGSLLVSRLFPRIPGPLTGIVLATLIYFVLNAVQPGIELGSAIGVIDANLPQPRFADQFLQLTLSSDMAVVLFDVLPLAAGLAVIACIPTLLVTVAHDNVVGERSNSNKELLALGFANMVASTFGSIAAAGSMGRTNMSLRIGARSRWSRAVSSLTVLGLLMLFGPSLQHFPMVAFAAALTIGSLQNIDRGSLKLLADIVLRRGTPAVGDAIVILAVTGTMVVVGVFQSLMLGIVIALAQFIVRMSRDPIRRTYTAERVRSNVDRVVAELSALEQLGQRIRVFELEGTLFFGTADKVASDVLSQRGAADCVILDLKRVTDIDSTGSKILLQLWQRLAKLGCQVAFSGVHQEKGHALLWGQISQEPAMQQGSFGGMDDALAWAEDHLLDQSLGMDRYNKEIEYEEIQALRGLSHDEIFQLARFLVREEFADGSVIFNQGDPGDRVLLILRGRVDVFVAYHLPQRKRIATLCPGTILGEIAILDQRPRGATTRARGTVVCYSLSHQSLRALTAEYPNIGVLFVTGLGRELAKRIRIMNAVAAELQN